MTMPSQARLYGRCWLQGLELDAFCPGGVPLPVDPDQISFEDNDTLGVTFQVPVTQSVSRPML